MVSHVLNNQRTKKTHTHIQLYKFSLVNRFEFTAADRSKIEGRKIKNDGLISFKLCVPILQLIHTISMHDLNFDRPSIDPKFIQKEMVHNNAFSIK